MSKNFVSTIADDRSNSSTKNRRSSKFERSNDDEKSNNDADSAILICRRFLKILGILRLNEDNKISWRWLLSSLLPIVCYFGLGIRTIPTILYIIIDAKDVIQICNLVGRVLFGMISWSKYVFLRSHSRDIEKCMRHMKIDWLNVENSANREIMLEYSRYGSLVTKVFAVFTYTGATWQATLPHVLKKASTAIVDDNATKIVTVRLFTIPSHFGFSFVTDTPIYEIIYTSQIVATFMMHSITIASYSVAVVSVMHACGRLKILIEKIERLIDDDDGKTEVVGIDAGIAEIVRHHVRTLKFISSAEKMLREICLIELGGCTIELCFLGYFNIVEWKAEHKNVVGIIVYLTLMITFTFDIFSFCFIGELLTQECARVGEMTYMIDWYRLPGKQPLALCLIMTMAHSPVTLTAGGAIQLSFRCFASVINTSVGYLNMLRAVMD